MNGEPSPRRVTADALARRDVERALREAVARDFDVHYQPLVNMRSGRVERLEALMRWRHPTAGPVAPSIFIPIAERAGLLTRLTVVGLRSAVRELASWRERVPELRVSLNLSLSTLHDRQIARACERAAAGAGGDGTWLGIEITESTLMRDLARTREAVARFAAHGIRVDIDDFGTGYSSLGRLADLAVDAVKIDRGFVQRMAVDHRREAIVRATIALGHDLGFEVVAEGVEDRKTWELLVAHGCDTAQGYHLAPPMPAQDVPNWLEAWDAGLAFMRRARIGGGLVSAAMNGRPHAANGLPHAANGRPHAANGRPHATRRGVLVVDDEPSIVEVVKDILEEHGFQVMTAANGQEALRIVEEGPPEVVLLDMNMPTLDGAGFTSAVRERGLRVPIVVMTAGPSAERWAKEIHADGYLSKPFELSGLLDITKRFAKSA